MVDETRLQLYTKYKEHKNYQKPELPKDATFAVLKYYIGKYGYDGDINDIFDTSTLTEEEQEQLSFSMDMTNNNTIDLIATLDGVNITQINIYRTHYTLRSNQVVLDTMPIWYPNLKDFMSYVNGSRNYDPAKWFGDNVNDRYIGLASIYKYIDGEVYKRTEEDIQTENLKNAKIAEIASLKNKLSQSDWIVTKIVQASFRDESESAELVEKYSVQLAERDSWRERINILEAEIAELPESF